MTLLENTPPVANIYIYCFEGKRVQPICRRCGDIRFRIGVSVRPGVRVWEGKSGQAC
jgi:hypothetical protein